MIEQVGDRNEEGLTLDSCFFIGESFGEVCALQLRGRYVTVHVWWFDL